jgi:hypothetical protein
MAAGSDSKRMTRSRRACLLASATLMSAVLVAGCGGSSPRPISPTATVGDATTPSSTASSTSHATTAGSSTATRSDAVNPLPAGPAGLHEGELAFARCMRANGVPNFPDPKPGGGFAVPVGSGPSAPAFQGAEATCQKLLPGGPPGPGSTTHPAPQTLAKLVRIARCMRAHGVSQFPDPVTSVPSKPGGVQEITDFDGAILLFPSTINLQAPAYKRALTACGAPPLGLPH